MTVLKRLLAVSLVASASMTAACSDATAPEAVDAELLAASAAELTDVFAANAAFTSMQALSAIFPPLAAGPVRAALAPVDAFQPLRRSPRSPRLALRAASAALRGPNDLHALFPLEALGVTFEWDVTADEYVAGNASGAPANGLRLRLYLTDPNTELPIEPLQQIGYVDLTDESTPQANTMGVLIRLFTVTVADYTVSEIASLSSPRLTALGYFMSADGLRRADFDLELTQHIQAAAQELNYYVTGANGTFIRLGVMGDPDVADFEFTVGRGRQALALEGSESGGTVSAAILFNGTAVATISGPADDPVIAGANGHELTNDELFAVSEIFGRSLLFLLLLTVGVFGPAVIVFGF